MESNTGEGCSALSSIIRARHSTRQFLPTPVPLSTLHSALSLAQLSPSNSNIQPWRLFITTGLAATRLKTNLSAYANANAPVLDTSLPESYQHLRSQLGSLLYGPTGYDVARDDAAGRKAASARNYDFFGAPVAGLVCIDRRLHDQDVLSVGMYLQTLVLVLAEEGLGTCVQVSIAGYEDMLRRELGFGEELKVLCGLAVGYEDPENRLNRLELRKERWEDSVMFFTE